MPRRTADSGALYRVRVEMLTADGKDVVGLTFLGPFSLARTARGAATAHRRARRGYGSYASAHYRYTIERAETLWHPIDSAPPGPEAAPDERNSV